MNALTQFNPAEQIEAAINSELAAIKALKLQPEVALEISETALQVVIQGFGSSHISLSAPAQCGEKGHFVFLTNILNDVKAQKKDLKDFWVEVPA